MATEKWIAGSGVGLTWTAAFTASNLDSIVDGNAVLAGLTSAATNQIDNSSALDMFADVMFVFGSLSSGASAFLGLYLYPLNQDNSTYGDGRYTASAAGPPPPQFFAGLGVMIPSLATTAQQGHFRRPDGAPIIIPPGKFKFVLYNKAGGTLVGSGGNQIYYRTFNRQVI